MFKYTLSENHSYLLVNYSHSLDFFSPWPFSSKLEWLIWLIEKVHIIQICFSLFLRIRQIIGAVSAMPNAFGHCRVVTIIAEGNYRSSECQRCLYQFGRVVTNENIVNVNELECSSRWLNKKYSYMKHLYIIGNGFDLHHGYDSNPQFSAILV